MSAVQQAVYKQDYIKAFELNEAVLPQTVRRDTQDRGGTTIFLVSGSGSRTATTRGARGLIPFGDNVQTNVTLTYKEAHDKVAMTSFNVFTAQGDQLAMMREQSLGVIHREQDLEILDALATGTVDLGTVDIMDMNTVLRISTMLANAKAGIWAPGNLFGVITPAVYASMVGNIEQFTNSDYTSLKKVDKGAPVAGGTQFFMGVEWIVHPDLPGVTGATSTNYVYHRDSVGYGVSSRGIDPYIEYVGTEDMTVRRTTIFHGAVKLQNAGIIKFSHNDVPLSA